MANTVMIKSPFNRLVMGLVVFIALHNTASAEGMIDIKPYVSANATYDDNVFRFANAQQASAAFGSPVTSDRILRTDIGVDAKVRLSRQLIKLSANINDNKYNRFSLLDNVGKSYSGNWNWRLGNDVFGEIGASKDVAIAGFTETRNPVRNTRITQRKFANAVWQFQPDWAIRVNHENNESDNSVDSFHTLNRQSDVYETGLQYANTSGTQIGLSYRNTTSTYANRTGFTLAQFGDENKQQELAVNMGYQPTAKTRLSGRVAQVKLDYKNIPQRAFNGLSERINLDYALTAKTAFNFSIYKELSAVEDVVSTYVETTGLSINPSWSITGKLILRGGMGFEKRNYLGSSGISLVNTANRFDESKTGNLSLIYLPTRKSLVQVSYIGERRTSNLSNLNYDDNTVSALFKYSF